MDDNMPQGHDEHVPPIVESPKESGGKAGPIIGIVVIIVVLLLGVLYFWGQRVDQAPLETDTQDGEVGAPVENTPETIESDMSDLEQELDDEFATMESELSTEF